MGSLHLAWSVYGCANRETNVPTSSSNVIISRVMTNGDCSYDVLRCTSRTRQMFGTNICYCDVRVHGGTLICKAEQDQHTLSYTMVDPPQLEDCV